MCHVIAHVLAVVSFS